MATDDTTRDGRTSRRRVDGRVRLQPRRRFCVFLIVVVLVVLVATVEPQNPTTVDTRGGDARTVAALTFSFAFSSASSIPGDSAPFRIFAARSLAAETSRAAAAAAAAIAAASPRPRAAAAAAAALGRDRREVSTRSECSGESDLSARSPGSGDAEEEEEKDGVVVVLAAVRSSTASTNSSDDG